MSTKCFNGTNKDLTNEETNNTIPVNYDIFGKSVPKQEPIIEKPIQETIVAKGIE